ILGSRNGPSERIFVGFQTEFPALDQSVAHLVLYDWSTLSEPLRKQAQSVLDWGELCLADNTFPREDYRELVEITVVFLGGVVPRGFKLHKPGAHHTARFMVYKIYIIK
ncbi:Uncharacterized protein APZ42_005748, partial [Daphnia magna]